MGSDSFRKDSSDPFRDYSDTHVESPGWGGRMHLGGTFTGEEVEVLTERITNSREIVKHAMETGNHKDFPTHGPYKMQISGYQGNIGREVKYEDIPRGVLYSYQDDAYNALNCSFEDVPLLMGSEDPFTQFIVAYRLELGK